MKVHNISGNNFESRIPKQRYVTQLMHSSIKSLLIRMNSEVTTVKVGDHFKSTITNKIKYNNNSFEDERRLTKKYNQKEQMLGFSVLKLGKNTTLDIDNETGEIIGFKKPFFKPWFLILKKAENILYEMRTNFYDLNSIQKEQITINELTPEGAEKMKKFVLQVEKQRLQEIVKNLEEGSK